MNNIKYKLRKYSRHSKVLLGLFLVVGLTLPGMGMRVEVLADAEPANVTAMDYPELEYTPTVIVNGTFDTRPWMTYTYNGVTYSKETIQAIPKTGSWKDILRSAPDNINISGIMMNGIDGGWNTSENKTQQGDLFEWVDGKHHGTDERVSGSGWTYSGTNANNFLTEYNFFVELNAANAAVLSQDLTTHGGDVIRWTLDHGIRSDSGAPSNQNMEVQIGAPEMNGTSIVFTEGTGNNINTHIVGDTKAVYSSTGVTGKYGSANASELEKLNLTKTADKDLWRTCKGVYVVPEGQDVTRFGFVSTSTSSPTLGNLMDNITFSTLIGGLTAKFDDEGNVVVTGYWGESDTSKKIVADIKIDDSTIPVNVDMSQLTQEKFKFIIGKEQVENSESISIHHEDYAAAKTDLKVEHSHKWSVSQDPSDLSKVKVVCTSTTGTCPLGGESDGSITISAENSTYDGTAYNGTVLTPVVGDAASPTVSDFENKYGVTVSNISYEGINGTSYGPSADAPKNVGEYTVKITVSAADGVTTYTASDDFAISPKELIITANNQDVPYADPLVVSSETSDVTIDIANGLADGDSLISVELTAGTTTAESGDINIGSVVIMNQGGEKTQDNYSITKYPGRYKIIHGHEWKYTLNQEKDTVSIECIGSHGTCDLTDKDAGNIKIKAENITYNGTTYDKAEIEKNLKGSLTMEDIGEISSIKYKGQEGTTTHYDETTEPPMEAGSYTAFVEITDKNDPTKKTTIEKNFTIGKKTILIKANDQTIKYGENISQNPSDVKVGLTTDIDTPGLVSGDSLTDITITPSTDDVTPEGNPGTLTPSAAIIKMGGSDRTNNYDITYADGNLIITKNKPNLDTPPSAEPITYGDTVGSSILTGGKVRVGEREVKGDFIWEEDEKGKKPSVDDSSTTKYKVKFVPTGEDAARFDPIDNIEVTIVVNPKPIDIIWDGDEYTYDGTQKCPTAEVDISGLIDGDSCSVSGVGGGETNSCIREGKDKFTAEVISLDNKNYKPSDNTKTHDFVIKPKELTENDVNISLENGNDNVKVTDVIYVISENNKITLDKDIDNENPNPSLYDYYYSVTTGDKNNVITIDFEGNYKGHIEKKITKPTKNPDPSGKGSTDTFIEIDKSVADELKPELSTPNPDDAKKVFIENIPDDATIPSETPGEADKKVKDVIKNLEPDSDIRYQANVYIKLREIESIPGDEDPLVEEKVANDYPKGTREFMYLDLSMYLNYKVTNEHGDKVYTENTKQIFDNNGIMQEVTVNIPSSALPGKGYQNKYYVLRVHRDADDRDNPELMELANLVQTDGKTGKISFSTDKYSTYVLLVNSKKIPGGGGEDPAPEPAPGGNSPEKVIIAGTTEVYNMPVKYASPKTGDTAEEIVLFILLLCGCFVLLSDKIKKGHHNEKN